MMPPVKASASDSINTEQTTGAAPKPSARSVAISRPRAATALYIVLSAPNNAPNAIIRATTVPSVVMKLVVIVDCSA